MEQWLRLSNNAEYDTLHELVERGRGPALMASLMERSAWSRTELCWAIEVLHLVAAERCDDGAAEGELNPPGWGSLYWALRSGWHLADAAGAHLSDRALSGITAQVQVLLYLLAEPVASWMERQAADAGHPEAG